MTDSPAARLIQPTIWASSATDVHVLLRSDGGQIYRADSADAGASFGAAVATGLPNNNSVSALPASEGAKAARINLPRSIA